MLNYVSWLVLAPKWGDFWLIWWFKSKEEMLDFAGGTAEDRHLLSVCLVLIQKDYLN